MMQLDHSALLLTPFTAPMSGHQLLYQVASVRVKDHLDLIEPAPSLPPLEPPTPDRAKARAGIAADGGKPQAQAASSGPSHINGVSPSGAGEDRTSRLDDNLSDRVSLHDETGQLAQQLPPAEAALVRSLLLRASLGGKQCNLAAVIAHYLYTAHHALCLSNQA